jgi:hypothetical protein
MGWREGETLCDQSRLDIPKILQCLLHSTTNAFPCPFPATILQPTAGAIKLGLRHRRKPLVRVRYSCHTHNAVCIYWLAVDRVLLGSSNGIRSLSIVAPLRSLVTGGFRAVKRHQPK